MRIIIDTNLWISFMLGRKIATMRTLLTHPSLEIYVCRESFVNFSQFNLGFNKFRKSLNTILAMQNDCTVTKEIIIVTILSLRNNSGSSSISDIT